MEASSIGISEALSQGDLAKIGHFYIWGITLTGYTENQASTQLHTMKDQNFRRTLFQHRYWCHKAEKAYVPADDPDYQISSPRENREVMWWRSRLWSQSSNGRKAQWHVVTSARVKHLPMCLLPTTPFFVCCFSLLLLLHMSHELFGLPQLALPALHYRGYASVLLFNVSCDTNSLITSKRLWGLAWLYLHQTPLGWTGTLTASQALLPSISTWPHCSCGWMEANPYSQVKNNLVESFAWIAKALTAATYFIIHQVV